MPVSGLVLTLAEHESERSAALDMLRSRPEITLGSMHGRRLPIVVDTISSDQDKTVWEWLHALSGVQFVDLVSTDSSADSDSPGTRRPAGTRRSHAESDS